MKDKRKPHSCFQTYFFILKEKKSVGSSLEGENHGVASHVIKNLPQLFRNWSLYRGDSRKVWKGAMQTALRPTNNALPRSEGEIIYSCSKLEYQVWKECQTFLATNISP